jgi:hypothetical protein
MNILTLKQWVDWAESNNMTNDFEKVELALSILSNCEVVQEFEDSIWIQMDKELWNQFQGVSDESTQTETPTAN